MFVAMTNKYHKIFLPKTISMKYM